MKNVFKTFINYSKKSFGYGSLHSKYIIIGSGFTGLSIAKGLIQSPYNIPGNKITVIDPYPEYLAYPYQKLHLTGYKHILKNVYNLQHVIPEMYHKVQEINEIYPQKKMLLSDNNSIYTYDTLILAPGLDSDFSHVEGFLYSLQDPNSQVFSYLDYEAASNKMTKFTGMMIRGISQGRFFKRDEEFLRTGEGNIVFVETEKGNYMGALYNIEILITLYDLLKKYRSNNVMKSIKFYYISPNSQLFSEGEKMINDFYLEELKKREINILFEKELKKITFDHFLNFKDGSNLEFNYCHCVPRSIVPAFLRFSEICGFNRKNEFLFDYSKEINKESKEQQTDEKDQTHCLQIDKENLKLKLYEDIYIAGDILDSFWDRTFTNCFLQASIISHNIKIDEFKLKKVQKVSYSPFEKLCQIHSFNKLMTVSNKEIKLEKLSWFKNVIFQKSLIIPESPLCKALYFEKMLGIKMNFKLK